MGGHAGLNIFHHGPENLETKGRDTQGNREPLEKTKRLICFNALKEESRRNLFLSKRPAIWGGEGGRRRQRRGLAQLPGREYSCISNHPDVSSPGVVGVQ